MPSKPMSTRRLVDGFLKQWEAHWDETPKYSPRQRRKIVSELTKTVLLRYESTGEVRFNGTELENAIELAECLPGTDEQYIPEKTEAEGLDPICTGFLDRLVAELDLKDMPQEVWDIFYGGLYQKLKFRYEQELFTQLLITPQELADQFARAEKVRSKLDRELRLDERDSNIRKKRGSVGTVGHTAYTVHR